MKEKNKKPIKKIQNFFVKNNIYARQTRSNLYLLRTLQIINKIKLLVPNRRIEILDLGCGEAYNTCVMNHLLPNSKIVDIDYKNCKTWSLIKGQGFKIEFINGDARKIPFKKNSFDIVIMWGLLEHIGLEKMSQLTSNNKKRKLKKLEERKCVREIYRVLKPTGFLMINYLPNKYTYIEFFTKYLKIHFHPKKFTKKEISSLLNENGFQITDIKRVHFLPSLYYFMGDKIGNTFNKYAGLLNFLDRIISKNTIKLFSTRF